MKNLFKKLFETTTTVETLPGGGKSIKTLSLFSKSYSLIPAGSPHLATVPID